jgi:hypothetical protein
VTLAAGDRFVGARLAAQQVVRPACATPAALVARLVAVQAQDYAAARWAVGVRLAGKTTEAGVSAAVASGAVLRTHVLRGTWQLVAPADVRWLLALVAPRLFARAARRFRELGIDAATIRQSNAAIVRALADRHHQTRTELAAALSARKIAVTGSRLSFLLWRAELEGLIASGVPRSRQPTYALLDERAPGPNPLPDRDAALAELARRYFASRGPASAADFTWWSGLAPDEARRGLAAAGKMLSAIHVGHETYWHGVARARVTSPPVILLPAFDEYLVAYRDRGAVLDAAHARAINAGGGMLDPIVVVGGRVRGTWRRELGRSAVTIAVDMFAEPSASARKAITVAAHRYAAFLGLTPAVTIRAQIRKRRKTARKARDQEDEEDAE